MENLQSENVSGSARIGITNSLQSTPILEKWKETNPLDEWQLTQVAPAAVDGLLVEGELDLGFVSTLVYGLYPGKYALLSGLAISGDGPVGPAYLFSHVPLAQLHGAPVLLNRQCATSVQLVTIILEEFNSVTPVYENDGMTGRDISEFQAVLAVGDEALRLIEESTYLYQFDLADIWKRKTGLPFVFSICAVNQDFCDSHPKILGEVHRQLLGCRDAAKENIQALCELSSSRLGISPQDCCDYLQSISFDFAGQKKKSLETFFEMLIKRGELTESALPLKLVANLSD